MTNFCLFTFSVCKMLQSVFYTFSIGDQLYCLFLVYFDLNWELLACQNTQKVNEQKFCCKSSGFVLVGCMSWTRYRSSIFTSSWYLEFRKKCNGLIVIGKFVNSLIHKTIHRITQKYVRLLINKKLDVFRTFACSHISLI